MDELKRLEPNRTGTPGYALGRLLAVLEDLQYFYFKLDNRDVKNTVTDRFYGSLSTTPVMPFKVVMSGAQDHLSKLRKERPKSYTFYSKQITDILASVLTIPNSLSVEDQALFSLGYFHQKQAKFEAIKESKANATTAETTDQGEDL